MPGWFCFSFWYLEPMKRGTEKELDRSFFDNRNFTTQNITIQNITIQYQNITIGRY